VLFLAGFNIGVEIAQMTVVLLVAPAIAAGRPLVREPLDVRRLGRRGAVRLRLAGRAAHAGALNCAGEADTPAQAPCRATVQRLMHGRCVASAVPAWL
jgi:hypothetical protein